MFRHIIVKSVATLTAVGGALAMSLAATPAVITSAPEIRTVSCHGYPADVSTTTQLSLRRTVGIYGSFNRATALVSADETGSGTPTGSVQFRLFDSDGNRLQSWLVGVDGGLASVVLPSTLPSRETYRITARFVPGNCATFGPSSAAPAFYTVNKAPTNTVVFAPNRERDQHPRVAVVVSSRSPLRVGGEVRIVITRRAVVVARRTVDLSDEQAVAWFRVLRPGYYDVEARYLGSRNFVRSRGEDDFRIFR